uniref:NADH-ubiquinone oxidoreductase chain 4L n=1 Tax=Ectrychotes andreae TaxID=204515 RepID=A0A7I6H8G9_9HEMI|nr:NADH dehydrogenase subunit 4L [Ectrychotes andreae]
MYFFIYMLIMISGFLVFCSMRKHILLTLLSLEFIMLSLFLMLFIYLNFYLMSNYFILVYLTFVVCEGVMGLGILVSLIRSHGNDMIMSLSMLGW